MHAGACRSVSVEKEASREWVPMQRGTPRSLTHTLVRTVILFCLIGTRPSCEYTTSQTPQRRCALCWCCSAAGSKLDQGCQGAARQKRKKPVYAI